MSINEARLRGAIFVLAATTAAFSACAPANARGVTLIQQSDGSVRTYRDVYMRLSGQTLTLRSADRKGVLTIFNGACSFTHTIERCLPYTVTLTQHGSAHSIALVHGTVFLNLTGSEQTLPLSSEPLAPRTVLVVLKTAHGTWVTVKGTLDEVTP